MRCESSGDLYPFTTKSRAISLAPSSFPVILPHIWNSRLGHPRDVVFNSLHSRNLIECNKAQNNVCHSCPLGN